MYIHPALIVLSSFLAFLVGAGITIAIARSVSPWHKSRKPYVGRKNKEKKK
jgi:hypothetical protein